ncbi:MAG: hypothetical protein M5T61_01135 [Acidimicrobiia bacterium]|nr:hypothetical protein [Acidimicrobiia bacterium]
MRGGRGTASSRSAATQNLEDPTRSRERFPTRRASWPQRRVRTRPDRSSSPCGGRGKHDGSSAGRVETLAAFAGQASLTSANARLYEEREQALARQVDLNQQKGDFVAAVSHELRTPLAVMLGGWAPSRAWRAGSTTRSAMRCWRPLRSRGTACRG